MKNNLMWNTLTDSVHLPMYDILFVLNKTIYYGVYTQYYGNEPYVYDSEAEHGNIQEGANRPEWGTDEDEEEDEEEEEEYEKNEQIEAVNDEHVGVNANGQLDLNDTYENEAVSACPVRRSCLGGPIFEPKRGPTYDNNCYNENPMEMGRDSDEEVKKKVTRKVDPRDIMEILTEECYEVKMLLIQENIYEAVMASKRKAKEYLGKLMEHYPQYGKKATQIYQTLKNKQMEKLKQKEEDEFSFKQPIPKKDNNNNNNFNNRESTPRYGYVPYPIPRPIVRPANYGPPKPKPNGRQEKRATLSSSILSDFPPPITLPGNELKPPIPRRPPIHQTTTIPTLQENELKVPPRPTDDNKTTKKGQQVRRLRLKLKKQNPQEKESQPTVHDQLLDKYLKENENENKKGNTKKKVRFKRPSRRKIKPTK